MKTEDYKKIFKSMPERAWLSSTLQTITSSGQYKLITEYLNGTKDINTVNNIEDLYAIKGTFFKLAAECKIIIDNIEKLNLDFLGEFEDKKMELSDIGISENDTFLCTKDFFHWDMIQVNRGSAIKIIGLKYAGKNSLIDCRFIDLVTDEKTGKNFPDSSDIKLALTFEELSDNFQKQ